MTHKIDRIRLRAVIKRVEETRRKGEATPWPSASGRTSAEYAAAVESWKAFHARHSPEGLTLLYSLMAHSRGRLHVAKRWVPVTNAPRVLETRTLADQAVLIASVLKEFDLPDTGIEPATFRVITPDALPVS